MKNAKTNLKQSRSIFFGLRTAGKPALPTKFQIAPECGNA
jgi:hypothetical protein